jgi:RNA-directed DNA polymerase
VILHEVITVVQRCKEIISEWLNGIGLELKPSKTRLVHTLNKHNGQDAGFNFLGFNVRQYPTGKYNTGCNSNGKSLGFKTLIKSSSSKLKQHYDSIAKVISQHKTASQAALIARLNPIIRGWANYYRTVVSKEIYAELDNKVYLKLKRWGQRRHPNKSGYWVADKYWQTIGNDNWVFATKQERNNPLRLQKHSATEIMRHVKVKGSASPYDGNLVYWSTRMGKNPEVPKDVATLLKRQKGKCAHCGLYFTEESVLEVDHVIPKSKGGKNSYENLQLLHRHCHDEKTASDIAEARATEMEVSQKMERVKQIAESFARGESKGLRLNEVAPGNKSGCNSAKPKPVIKAKSLGNRGINDNDLITEEPDEVKTSRPVLKTSGTRESLA